MPTHSSPDPGDPPGPRPGRWQWPHPRHPDHPKGAAWSRHHSPGLGGWHLVVPLGALGCPGGMGLKHEVSRYVQVINIDKYWWPSPDMGLNSKCRAWYIFVRWIITDDWENSHHLTSCGLTPWEHQPVHQMLLTKGTTHHSSQSIYIYPSFQSWDSPGYVGFCIYAATCIPTKYFRNIVQKISNEINTPTRYAHLPSTWWNRFSIQ